MNLSISAASWLRLVPLRRCGWLVAAVAMHCASAWATPPAAPTNLSMTVTYPATGLAWGRWTWSDNSGSEDGFLLNRSLTGPSSGFDPFLTGIAANATSVVAAFGVVSNSHQYFRLKAYKGVEESNPSNVYDLQVPASTTFNAPSNAVATAPTESSVRLAWNDNSTSEEGFYIEWRVPGGTFTAIDWVYFYQTNVAYTVSPNTDHEFRVRASKGDPEQVTPYSNVATVHVPFYGPTNLTATAIGEQAVQLQWQDNSQVEDAYAVEARIQGSSTWVWLFDTLPNTTSTTINLNPSGHPYLPYRDTTYEFRVLATYQSSVSDPSNVASATTPFHAPSNVQAVNATESTMDISWLDNSQVEAGYQILVRGAGDTQWTIWDSTVSNTTAFTVGYLPSGTDLEFAVRAYHTVFESSDIIYSAVSPFASATTAAFHAPSSVQAVNVTDSTAGLTWLDNSLIEDGYEILMRVAGETQWTAWAYAAANATSLTFGNLPPGTNLEFAVRAYQIDGSDVIYSAISTIASAATKDGFLGRGYEPIQLGIAFSYQVQTTTNMPRQSLTVGALPGGLNFNPTTAVISGTPAVSGAFQVPMQAVFQGGWTNNASLALRIVRPAAPPVTGATITNHALAVGGSASVPMADKFSDPDTEAAVRMSTSIGDIDIALYASATPQTVSNFLGYADRGDYADVAMHRSVPGFVVQGGGYKATAEPNSFMHIATQPSPTNEPGIPNLRGTIAMAKQGGNPNSATSEFFFNLGDNTENLDNQNGGFTAFGRIPDSSMAVVDAMAALPYGHYPIDIGGSSVTFSNWPMNAASAPPSMDQSKLVTINSVTPLPSLGYALTGNTSPGVVSAVVTNGQIDLTGLAPGQSTLTITATDLDGSTSFQSFDVVVTGDFTQWASGSTFPGGQSAPGDDGDRDGLNNFQEFAFLGNPQLPDSAAVRPALKREAGGAWGITFRLRKYTDGLAYRVEASTNMVSWRTVWDSSEGLSLPHVQAQDQGDHYLVTVDDPAMPPGANRYFLRVMTLSTTP